MANFSLTILKLSIIFCRNSVGCINNPYTTYRRLAKSANDTKQTIFILLMALGYFAFASLVRIGVRHPYLLTLKFNLLTLGAGLGFMSMVFFLFLVGKIFRREGKFETLFLLWSYSLLPTIVWFFATSVLYIFLPPPRTFSLLGKLYSVVYMAFSIALFFWKAILYYLTLRFGLRLDLFRIAVVSIVLSPIIIGYSILMYNLGIFRIPFL